jgi:hypothetical protein
MIGSDLNSFISHYAELSNAEVISELGYGVDGVVWLLERRDTGRFAVKIHRHNEAYQREKAAYQRLKGMNVAEVLGIEIPQLLNWSDEMRAIEMTTVNRPFLLDFAGATLDEPQDFSEETWAMWEQDRSEKFDDNWPRAKKVIAELEVYGIYLTDVHPGNLAFE